jgi:SpoVK/Ycf46/Vps4 family AAA+-type ATPase
MFAEALAHECRCNFVSVRLHDIFSPFLGESESYLRHLFRTARNATPCMLFLDDLDVIATKRDLTGGSGGNGGSGGSNSVGGRVLATLLNEMDGIESNEGVVVVGATNSIDDVDPALIRPGRLDVTVLIHAPTAMDRIDMFQKLTATTPLDDDVDVQLVGQLTEGWNGTWFVV